MTHARTTALAALAILAFGCGSGDDDSTDDDAANTPEATDAAEPGDDARPPTTEIVEEPVADAPAAAETGTADANISDGTGTMTIALPDGRTEQRDVACSIYADQFEVTFEYSDILDDQSVNFYYREEGGETSDVNFVFQDPQLGGLAARNVGTASNPAVSGTTLSVDLSVLIVGSVDEQGNPETADVSVTGTCAES